MRMIADQEVMRQWTSDVGGADVAIEKIRGALKCSYSKADKMAKGAYEHGLSPFEQRALLRLTKKPEDVLFPAKARPKAV